VAANSTALAESAAVLGHEIAHLSEALGQERETNVLLLETITELELSLEDAGWRRLAAEGQVEFSHDGLRRIAALCQLMALKNPLIKRGLNLRFIYTWGQGVAVAARATGKDGGQDVNAIVQRFLDDKSNRRSFTGQQARLALDKALGTDGNLFLALFTAPRTGRVQVRSIPFVEISDVISNPEDRADPWFYKRVWTVTTVDPGTARMRQEPRTVFYPALGYTPRGARLPRIDGYPVQWDAPVLHVVEDRPDGWKFGVPTAYAAIDWARAYKELLEDWARLVKALSRFAWRTTAKGSKQAAVKKTIATAPGTDATGAPLHAGATAIMGPDQSLEAIPKTGATIDVEAGRPLAMMVASALDVPITMLLEDPGQTGARAVATTLDRPTELTMAARRGLYGEVLGDVFDYVIDQAVKAPAGPLQGTVTRDEDGREVVELADEEDRTIDVDWPALDDIETEKLVKAITEADATGKVPPLVTARLLLQVLGVTDVDALIEEMMDEDGNFIDPNASAGQAAVDAFRRGEDPARLVSGGDEDEDREPEDETA
jgi:hypothetical protein